MYRISIKRIFDLSFLLIFSPLIIILFILISFLIIAFDGKPVIFSQKRGGFKGKKFTIYKFSTMNQDVDKKGKLLPDKDRITKIGNFLRSVSLDEIPTFYNVLIGNMSLVGPRPFIAEYLLMYNKAQMRRHDVIPGITGWAQINGRNQLMWEKKFDLDLWYVDNQSFILDLKIIILTFIKVFQRSDINYNELNTMPRFDEKNEKKI